MSSEQNYPQTMSEVNKLSKKGVVKNTANEEGKLISTIFLRSKSDSSNQKILNLDYLKQNWEFNYFKMEDI